MYSSRAKMQIHAFGACNCDQGKNFFWDEKISDKNIQKTILGIFYVEEKSINTFIVFFFNFINLKLIFELMFKFWKILT